MWSAGEFSSNLAARPIRVWKPRISLMMTLSVVSILAVSSGNVVAGGGGQCGQDYCEENVCTFNGIINTALGDAKLSLSEQCKLIIGNIGSSGEDGIRALVDDLLPVVQGLLREGRVRQARLVARRAVRRIDVHGHVTVLKIRATTRVCLLHLRRLGADDELIASVQAAREAAVRGVEATRDWAVDSFFDIFT